MRRALVIIGLMALSAPLVLASINQERATAPLVVNTTLTSANTEYCYTVTGNGLHGIEFRARNTSDLKFAFTAGTTGTTYFTLLGGSHYSSDKIFLVAGQVVCWQSTAAGEIVEMVAWR